MNTLAHKFNGEVCNSFSPVSPFWTSFRLSPNWKARPVLSRLFLPFGLDWKGKCLAVYLTALPILPLPLFRMPAVSSWCWASLTISSCALSHASANLFRPSGVQLASLRSFIVRLKPPILSCFQKEMSKALHLVCIASVASPKGDCLWYNVRWEQFTGKVLLLMVYPELDLPGFHQEGR